MKAKGDIAEVCEAYQMVNKKEWMGMNRMHLTLITDINNTVNSIQILLLSSSIHFELNSTLSNVHFACMLQMQKFGTTLLVKDLSTKEKSKFSFKRTNTVMKASIDIAYNDMLMNFTHLDDMAMNRKKL